MKKQISWGDGGLGGSGPGQESLPGTRRASLAEGKLADSPYN